MIIMKTLVNKRIKFLLAIYLFINIISISAKSNIVTFKDSRIFYQGRILFKDQGALLSWSGTSVTIWFEGSGISAVLKGDTSTYFNVVLDNKVVSKLHTDSTKRSYILASGLSNGKHKLELFKRTEWSLGQTLFYGFELFGRNKILPCNNLLKRKIEFYGNSVTCGLATEDSTGNDFGYGSYENNYLSYSAITARYFSSQYSCISRSGIGVMVSWFPQILPEMYNLTDPRSSTSFWDFSKYTPDIVVVNLLQNDSWIVTLPNEAQFKARFGSTPPGKEFIVESYKNFIERLRNKYKNAHIICVLGNMDGTKEGSQWPGYIEMAVSQLNDSKIHALFFPYKKTDGHPRIPEQQAMAKQLISYIEKTIKW